MKYFIFACLCLAQTTLLAQAAGNESYSKSKVAGNREAYGNSNGNIYEQPKPLEQATLNGNVMTFEVKCLYNAKADAYTAIFNVVQLGKDAAETDATMNVRLSAFVNAMKNSGIAQDDIVIDMISFVPVFELKEGEARIFSKTFQETPAGFELQKNVHVRFTRPETLDKIVSFATQSEIYDLVKVDYFVNDSEKMYDTMRSRAVEQIKKKVADYAKLGVRLDTMEHVLAEASNAIYPVERYQRYQAFAAQSLDAVKKKAEIKTVRKPVSIYYNKLPYNDFDIIINPTIVEPAVQFTYNLKVQYTYVKEKPQPKIVKYFYTISPNGDLKSFDVK
jgi:uncharacterized protein YggE